MVRVKTTTFFYCSSPQGFTKLLFTLLEPMELFHLKKEGKKEIEMGEGGRKGERGAERKEGRDE